MGAIRRPILFDVAVLSNCCSRSFHASGRRLEADSNSAPESRGVRSPRKIVNANAARAVSDLQTRRVPPGNSTPTHISSPNRGQLRTKGTGSSDASRGPSNQKFIQLKQPISRTNTGPSAARGATPPGTMVRAPSKLRLNRNAPGTKTAGPNLRGRDPKGTPTSVAGPRARDNKKGGSENMSQSEVIEGTRIETMLPDSMVKHLLRLQRKEWDPVPYTPKYAPGSFEANELIHAGRELFKGESPPVKVWGRLEKTLGIVGMHGAEAHLSVRRVLDGEEKPFGKEDEIEFDPTQEVSPYSPEKPHPVDS